jgi:hypothetical protein
LSESGFSGFFVVVWGNHDNPINQVNQGSDKLAAEIASLA